MNSGKYIFSQIMVSCIPNIISKHIVSCAHGHHEGFLICWKQFDVRHLVSLTHRNLFSDAML